MKLTRRESSIVEHKSEYLKDEKRERRQALLDALDTRLDQIETWAVSVQKFCELLQFHDLTGVRGIQARSISIRLRAQADKLDFLTETEKETAP